MRGLKMRSRRALGHGDTRGATWRRMDYSSRGTLVEPDDLDDDDRVWIAQKNLPCMRHSPRTRRSVILDQNPLAIELSVDDRELKVGSRPIADRFRRVSWSSSLAAIDGDLRHPAAGSLDVSFCHGYVTQQLRVLHVSRIGSAGGPSPSNAAFEFVRSGWQFRRRFASGQRSIGHDIGEITPSQHSSAVQYFIRQTRGSPGLHAFRQPDCRPRTLGSGHPFVLAFIAGAGATSRAASL